MFRHIKQWICIDNSMMSQGNPKLARSIYGMRRGAQYLYTEWQACVLLVLDWREKKALYGDKRLVRGHRPLRMEGVRLERMHSICFPAHIKGCICVMVEKGMSGQDTEGQCSPVALKLWAWIMLLGLWWWLNETQLGRGVFPSLLTICTHHHPLMPTLTQSS